MGDGAGAEHTVPISARSIMIRHAEDHRQTSALRSLRRRREARRLAQAEPRQLPETAAPRSYGEAS